MFADMAAFWGWRDFVPAFDIEDFFCLLPFEMPVDSANQNARKATWIYKPGETLPEGVVYKVPGRGFFYAPIEEETGILCIDKAYRLISPRSRLMEKASEGNTHTPSELGPFGARARREVQKWLLTAYYGRRKAAEYFVQYELG